MVSPLYKVTRPCRASGMSWDSKSMIFLKLLQLFLNSFQGVFHDIIREN
jgi:hypothetical protein